MRYRQLINEVIDRNGYFGHIFYSQENAKLALVGTVAKINYVERMDDGGIYVQMEGVSRFFVQKIVAEKPYAKAKVQLFDDYCKDETLASELEKNLLNELRYSVKLLKKLVKIHISIQSICVLCTYFSTTL